MRCIGGAVGLALDCSINCFLDKHFVFVRRERAAPETA